MKIKDGKITFSKKETNDGIKTLGKARQLLQNGKRWIQGEEKLELDGDDAAFCMRGALREADGAGEYVAGLALICAIYPELSFYRDDDDSVFDIANNNETIITDYNDKKTRKYKDISLKMRRAETLLRKGEIKVKVY